MWVSPREFSDALRARQRMQVCIGDSNMAEEAEYLRVGTTLLVLDAIDAGGFAKPPKVFAPIRALRKYCEDPELKCAVPCGGGTLSGRGRKVTALQLQQYYWQGCRDFVDKTESNEEAEDILRRWKEVLDALESNNRSELIGRLDWVTKLHLLEAAEGRSTAENRRKIDIKYHELSTEGYFHQLKSTGVVHEILDEDQVERAIRTAPSDTPATTRGQYIREFAQGSEPLKVNWSKVVIGSGWHAKVLRLANFGQKNSTDT